MFEGKKHKIHYNLGVDLFDFVLSVIEGKYNYMFLCANYSI